ncbi:MAG: hypothetical protein VW683_12265 [Betaproteobacteria bacterium]
MYNDELTKKLAETARQVMAGESVETPIEEAKKPKLKVGQEVSYKGKWAKVEEIDGDDVTVSDEDGKEFTVDVDRIQESVKETTELNEAKIDKVLDLLISAIGKNSSKPEFQKASQAYQDWANAFGNSRKRLLEGGPKSFWMDLEEVLDIRLDEDLMSEATGDKEAYQKFFNDTLKKYGVKSPSELKGDDEKKFYDEIDTGWKGDDEKPEKNESVELEEQTPDFHVKYAKSKRGPIQVTKFMTLDKAKKFLSDRETEGYRGIISKDGKPVKESAELEEGKIDLKKKVKNEKEFESYMDSFKGPDILAAVEKLDSGEKHQKGTVGFFLSQQMSMKEGTVRLDARRREFREKIKKLAYAKAKKMIQDQDEEELEEGVFSNFIKHSIRKFIHKLSPEGRAAKAEKIAAAKEKLLNDYQRIKSAQERIKAASAALDSIKTVVKDKAHLASVEKELQSDFEDIDDELEEKNNN